MEKLLAAWMKSVKIEMIKRDLDGSGLAEAVGKTRAHTAAVINGKLIAPNTANAISNFLNIQNAPYENIRREHSGRNRSKLRLLSVIGTCQTWQRLSGNHVSLPTMS